MTKDVRGECQHCGDPFNFPAEAAGQTTDCPHCGRPTELLLARPPEMKSPANTKAILYTVLALLILGGGLLAAVVLLKRAERLTARQREATPIAADQNSTAPVHSFAAQGFQATAVTLEKTPNGSVINAVGTIRNLTDRRRLDVSVEIELLDADGHKVGEAKVAQVVLEPGADWRFRIPVLEKNAAAARVLAITERQ